jgi:hypothetical protein
VAIGGLIAIAVTLTAVGAATAKHESADTFVAISHSPTASARPASHRSSPPSATPARSAAALAAAASRATAASAAVQASAARVAAARAASQAAASASAAAARAAQAPPPDSGGASDCTPGYSPCIPLGPDVDCAGGSGNGPRFVQGPIEVTGSDPYRLDADHDGVGCES